MLNCVSQMPLIFFWFLCNQIIQLKTWHKILNDEFIFTFKVWWWKSWKKYFLNNLISCIWIQHFCSNTTKKYCKFTTTTYCLRCLINLESKGNFDETEDLDSGRCVERKIRCNNWYAQKHCRFLGVISKLCCET